MIWKKTFYKDEYLINHFFYLLYQFSGQSDFEADAVWIQFFIEIRYFPCFHYLIKNFTPEVT